MHLAIHIWSISHVRCSMFIKHTYTRVRVSEFSNLPIAEIATKRQQQQQKKN